MDEKKTFKECVKDWWRDNKRVIKAGVICISVGCMYGFIKGMAAADGAWLKHGFKMPDNDLPDPDDLYGLTEATCDDPELLELVNWEIENS